MEEKSGGRPKVNDIVGLFSQVKSNVTKEELELIKAKAKHKGLTVSAYVRELIKKDLLH